MKLDTKQVEDDKKLYHYAFYDTLTNLANRITLEDRLKHQLIRQQRHKKHGSLLFIDIDNFKHINDSLGHYIGDALLKIFAQKVSTIIREEDTFARLGGDEFVILLVDLSSTIEETLKRSTDITQKLHQLFHTQLNVKEHPLYITLSIGVKIIDNPNLTYHEVIKHADIAMYQVKDKGKNGTSFYENSMSLKVQAHLALSNELHEAIKNKEFELYFQAIANTHNTKINSCEALIRWNHPQKGLVSPDDFIPFAESSNLIIEIGDWVIENACTNYDSLKINIGTIAINISTKQFQADDFVEKIIATTSKHNIHPSAFKLELTESVSIENLSNTIEKMKKLKSFGFSFSMDDFGTGYSSLSYLRNLPFDYLKIDRSFITHISHNTDDLSLVKMFISIAKQFHFQIIAEGVETQEENKLLQDLECEYIQGYYLSKPLNLKDFQALFQEE